MCSRLTLTCKGSTLNTAAKPCTTATAYMIRWWDAWEQLSLAYMEQCDKCDILTAKFFGGLHSCKTCPHCLILSSCAVLQARLIGSNTITAATVNVAALTGDSFSCSYPAPQAPGLYVLEVTAGDRHVGGSPFSVRVSEEQWHMALPFLLWPQGSVHMMRACRALVLNKATPSMTRTTHHAPCNSHVMCAGVGATSYVPLFCSVLCSPVQVSTGTATTAVSQQTLSAAASARAQLNPSAMSAATPLATVAGTSAAHAASGGANASSSDSSHDSIARSGAAAAAASREAAAEPRMLDKLSWWGDVARRAYAAIDGSLQGFDDTDGSKTPDDSPIMSASEAEMVKVGNSSHHPEQCKHGVISQCDGIHGTSAVWRLWHA